MSVGEATFAFPTDILGETSGTPRVISPAKDDCIVKIKAKTYKANFMVISSSYLL